MKSPTTEKFAEESLSVTFGRGPGVGPGFDRAIDSAGNFLGGAMSVGMGAGIGLVTAAGISALSGSTAPVSGALQFGSVLAGAIGAGTLYANGHGEVMAKSLLSVGPGVMTALVVGHLSGSIPGALIAGAGVTGLMGAGFLST